MPTIRRPGKMPWGLKVETQKRSPLLKKTRIGRIPSLVVKKPGLGTRIGRRLKRWLHGGTPVTNRNLPLTSSRGIKQSQDTAVAKGDAANRAVKQKRAARKIIVK